jgi:hypothetical protein
MTFKYFLNEAAQNARVYRMASTKVALKRQPEYWSKVSGRWLPSSTFDTGAGLLASKISRAFPDEKVSVIPITAKFARQEGAVL